MRYLVPTFFDLVFDRCENGPLFVRACGFTGFIEVSLHSRVVTGYSCSASDSSAACGRTDLNISIASSI